MNHYNLNHKSRFFMKVLLNVLLINKFAYLNDILFIILTNLTFKISLFAIFSLSDFLSLLSLLFFYNNFLS